MVYIFAVRRLCRSNISVAVLRRAIDANAYVAATAATAAAAEVLLDASRQC